MFWWRLSRPPCLTPPLRHCLDPGIAYALSVSILIHLIFASWRALDSLPLLPRLSACLYPVVQKRRDAPRNRHKLALLDHDTVGPLSLLHSLYIMHGRLYPIILSSNLAFLLFIVFCERANAQSQTISVSSNQINYAGRWSDVSVGDRLCKSSNDENAQFTYVFQGKLRIHSFYLRLALIFLI